MIPTAVGSEPSVCHVSLSQRLSSAVSCGSPSFCGSVTVRPSPRAADRCPLGGSRSGAPLVSVCSESRRGSLVCAAPMVWVGVSADRTLRCLGNDAIQYQVWGFNFDAVTAF